MRNDRAEGLVLSEPRKRRVEGFTLIEMLVVVLILGILLAIVTGTGQYMIRKAAITNVTSFIKALNEACNNYKTDYHAYPPAKPYDGSQNLYWYLGRPLPRMVQFGENAIRDKRPAFITFTADRLGARSDPKDPESPAYLMDIWQQRIEFANPGTHHKKGVDIWSPGLTPKDPDAQIGNWQDE